MRRQFLSMLVAGLVASPLAAQSYTSPFAFFGAAGTPSYTETFETVPFAKDVAFPSFTIAGTTYTGQAGTNVFVSSPGYFNYGAGLNPTTSSILTANGDENFLIQLLAPQYAVGFDVYYNGLGPATASFFNGATLLGSIGYNGSAFLGFNGFIASMTTPITSVQFVSTLGGQLNTGIDNLALVAVAPVPEPATLTLFATGIVGLALLRRRRA
jgi:PEP-CTERM motif